MNNVRLPFPCAALLGLAVLLGVQPAARAETETSYVEVMDWLKNNASAPADGLAPGSYGAAQVAALAPYLPPGLVEQFNFPELTLDLVPTQRYVPIAAYRQATLEHAGMAALDAHGGITGYVAGQPFSAAQIDAAPPEQAGYMVAWDQIFRWQHYGYHTQTTMSYVQPATATGKSPGLAMEGGGRVERDIVAYYHRVYLARLAQLADSGYRLDLGDGNNLHWKEYLEFISPFDVNGTKFVVERSLDPKLPDQVYSYLAVERRVRRLSAEERADRWMGTDMTLDDFEAFSGRVLDYDWHYLGRKVMLHVANSRQPTATFFGPHSHVAHDQWQLRPCYVVEATPTWKAHPYARRVQFFDAETFSTVMTLVFDHQDRLWKVLYTVYRHADAPPAGDLTPELSVPVWAGTAAIDLVSQSTTLARESKPSDYEGVSVAKVKRIFDVSALTNGR